MNPERYMRVRALADELIASCGDYGALNDRVNELEQDEARLLDTMALECACCNHWFPSDTMIDCGHSYECSECHEPTEL